ncbi:hemolysin [Xanthomonas vasicola pv. vasculorum NCPPB 895]|uniref:Smlt3024 family type IV secretion system effector n=1 Tax=Xanthomonas vasicola TaxID=56459 RepID=UPI00034C1241|nr:XVIPCD domain-containing protein [Xanthomonas vasicola]KEZ95880.1 hemolysin [Xanthomonas vasicola pv. vasculorum NCPPB 895]MBV7306052.1 hemolysin [Xanthomonas vasicola pv. vasculorum]MDO6935349.1 hemolysin [Xanthomonas vasicola]MDO6939249.1 hemolysin [Xanthomonas vasicola]
MGGLTQQNLTILRSYAKAGNRELYWNYLSQLPGADGYGTLALGVVRNDSLPGRVANRYAQDYANTQHESGSRFANAQLSERQWESFGQTLLERDLELRQAWLRRERPDLALNLPGASVMLAHDRAFEQHRLDPNCWTPRVLLQAALEKSGPQKLEQIWTNMLDNGYAGASRIGNTGYETFSQMGMAAGSEYLAKLGTTEAIQMLEGRSAVDPNVIGSNSFYAMYFEKEQKWVNVSASGGHLSMREETNPARIAELDDARAVRLERQQKATQFHEDDPYRSITRSPFTASVDGAPDQTQAPTKLADIGPDHRDYNLLQQVRTGVGAIDAQAGRTPDENSERLIASVMTLARQNNLDRADHVVLSNQTAEHPAGRTVFVVQGELNNPAHLRATMSTDVAVRTPVEQSLQQLETASVERQRALMQGQQQDMDNRVRENMSMRMA